MMTHILQLRSEKSRPERRTVCFAAVLFFGLSGAAQSPDIRIFLQHDTAYIFKTGKDQLTNLTIVPVSEAPENGLVYDALTGNRRMSRDGQRLSVDMHADSIWSIFLPDDPRVAPLHSIHVSALSDLPVLDTVMSRQERIQRAISVGSLAPNLPYLQNLKRLPYLDSVYQCLRSDPLELYILAGDSLYLHTWNGNDWNAIPLGTLPVCGHFEVLVLTDHKLVVAADGSMYLIMDDRIQPHGVLPNRSADLILISDLDAGESYFIPLSYLQWKKPLSGQLESAIPIR